MKLDERIQDFLAGRTFAVAGASKDRAKYGNKVLRCYLQNGRVAFAVNPRDTEVEGVPCVPKLGDLPEQVHGLSIITPSVVTEKLVEDAHAVGITRIWMQPGAESSLAIERCRELGISLISGGPCVLVVLGFSEHA
ncbi:MAG: CoA-binding protein [Planctomycetota bacterium]|nr:CoA-binding protein [Planctomycetota bacterium]